VIVFCGIASEPPLALAIQAAEERGLEHVVLNQGQFHLYDIRLDLSATQMSGSLWAHNRDYPLDRVRGVYTRLADAQDVSEPPPRRIGASSESASKATFVHSALYAWLQCATCRVANRGHRSGRNISRSCMLQRVRRSGFLVPETLVTTDPIEVLAFQRRHQRVVYKSTSATHSIVHELTQDRARDLDEIRHLPTLFQAHVDGMDVRVHVVGDEAFATKLAKQTIDRHTLLDDVYGTMEPITLPDEIETSCRALSRDLGLLFCGIDLRVTPDVRYFCLEVDPSPTFSVYQEGSGQPIAQALVGYLAGLQ
jgi:hypothetical protein